MANPKEILEEESRYWMRLFNTLDRREALKVKRKTREFKIARLQDRVKRLRTRIKRLNTNLRNAEMSLRVYARSDVKRGIPALLSTNEFVPEEAAKLIYKRCSKQEEG